MREDTRSAKIDAILAELRVHHVKTERDRELAMQLNRLLRVDEAGRQTAEPVRFTADLETRGITLIDGPGGGKTTSLRWLLSETAALNPDTGPPRHLHVQVPSPASLKSLGLEILRSTGWKEVSERATAWMIWQTLRHRLSTLGITVLWIDEAQDLFLCRSAREMDDMLKTIKSLMLGESGVIVILSGTDRLSEITGFDPQVNRRFTKVVPKNLVIGADEKKLSELVSFYAAKAGLRSEWSAAMSGRLIHGSRGRFGRAVETVINAIERALRDEVETLTPTHFAEAWGMQEGCAWEDNVFMAKDWASLDLDRGADEFEAARTIRQMKQVGRS